MPLLNSSAYCAAKGGLGLLTKVMALELAELIDGGLLLMAAVRND